MDKHLIVKLSAIGDVIMTIPAVEHFQKKRGGEIWWLCGRTAAPILNRYSFITKVISTDEKKLFTGTFFERVVEVAGIWKTLAGQSFSTSALLHYDRRFQTLVLPIRARRKICLQRGIRDRDMIRGRSYTDEYARILLGRDGAIPERLQPIPLHGLRQWKKRLTGKIGLVPGGARNVVRESPNRRWPLEHYVELARLLLEQGFEVNLLGDSNDRWILPAFAGLRVIDHLGALPLLGSIGLIQELDALVTHDTGLLHMAGLTTTPTLALFGPTQPRESLPNSPFITCLWGGEFLACRPCYDGLNLPGCPDNLCLRALSPDAIKRALERLLSSHTTPLSTAGDANLHILSYQ